MIPFVMASWASGPILAPYIGGHLQHWFSWKANFYFLAIYSALIFVSGLKLPETLKEKHSLNFSTIKKNYLYVITSPIFFGWALMAVVLYAFLIVFAVIAPFLIENVLHYSPVFYGRIALLVGIVWFTGSFIAQRLTCYRITSVLPKLCLLSIITNMIILILVINTELSVYQLTIPALLLILIASTIFTFCYGTSITLFPQIAGSNSASAGATLSLGAGIVSSLAVILKTNSDIPLFTIFLIFFLISTIFYFTLLKKRLKQARE